ncbi:helix-turn-helix transcriptional regulator [Streptomyces sp. SID14478]|uniref:helix-turn-helix transcriptional regulator n=1 Tax=Streptomyces sp. SID14478 TaxID=2706073 RepID=UPI0013D8E900|nr:helix-turn-helix transcriptional regulator [Streptomyces sp. SID14478]NEB75511.1 helix-turn-helix transcriptional regulator [Streptomyces sp. SID14478]
MTAEYHDHGAAELCETGLSLYSRALREGRVTVEEAEEAPCLEAFGLLRRDADTPASMHPVPPAVALPGLLQAVEEDITLKRRHGEKLAASFAPLIAQDAQRAAVPDAPMISVLLGIHRINDAIQEAAEASTEELLTIQPGGPRPPEMLASNRPREQQLLARGGRMRTLYQHPARHYPTVLAHFEQLSGDVQVRTLDEVTERLIMLDRTVAFIPASSDRTAALEIRHPALISYLATTFERLWRLATPLFPYAAAEETAVGPVSARQRTIATLLIEGHTDAVIAERLGMNIRTVRVHIAKLAATLGSESRAQLGYFIGQSGILAQEQ